MIQKLIVAQTQTAKEVLEIQRSAYKIEAEYIGFADLPPLKETIQDLQASEEHFFGCYIKGELSGVISIQIENKVLEICRLFVHPNQFRKGIAQQLLDYVQAHLQDVKEIKVATGTDNTPAIEFYQCNNFSKLSDIRTAEGLSITLFNKNIVTCY